MAQADEDGSNDEENGGHVGQGLKVSDESDEEDEEEAPSQISVAQGNQAKQQIVKEVPVAIPRGIPQAPQFLSETNKFNNYSEE